jgi:single-stranded-DNA-specific exonuclease
MIWEKLEINADEVRRLARRWGLDLITASILVRRNSADPQLLRYFFSDDVQLLHNPFLFRDMPGAVTRIRQALARDERITVFGDKDVDGITSTVLLVELLQELGGRVDWQLPGGDDDYGLTEAVIRQLAAAGCGLLISVDCGISNLDEIALASSLGLDTIVVDHHNPLEHLPQAAAIINPKVEGCGYPFRDLAGCGVAAKLDYALRFAATEEYGRSVWLFNTRPENETYTLEAVRLENLVEVERHIASVVPGMTPLEKLPLGRRLAGQPLLVYDLGRQKKLLARLGLDELASGLEDFQPRLASLWPAGSDKSLLRLLNQRRMKIPGMDDQGELDLFIELYRRAVLAGHPELIEAHLNILDLAALGTLADLMPLRDENRIIVRRGVERINENRRPGLRELLVRQNLYGRRVTTTDLSWQVTPVLNAAGRMGDPEKAAVLLLSRDPEEQRSLTDAILNLNKKRKSMGDKIWTVLFPQAQESLAKTGGKCVLVHDASLPKGITGIIAARLSNCFKTPALAVSVGTDKSVGSLRSPYSMNGFLDQFSDLLLNFGGHDCAAGFTLESRNLDQFCDRFYRLAASLAPADQAEEVLGIDAEVPPRYLNPDLIKVVENFQPYGEDSPPLVFLTRGVEIEQLDIIGRQAKAHLRLLIKVDRFRWPAVYWNAADRAGRDFTAHERVDIVYRLGRNYFQNTETLQLTILDLRRA